MKDIIDEIDSRIKSPLFGYFLFSLLALNWSELFYLMVDIGPVADRIVHFNNGTDSKSLFLYPFLIASAYSIIYPWIQYIFIYLGKTPTELKNYLQAESENKLLIKKKELKEARDEILKSAENELIERAKRDAELSSIENKEVREKLQLEIDQLRRERDEVSSNTGKDATIEASPITSEQEQILRLITSNGGNALEKHIINESEFDKVKTEYYLEDLEANNYLTKKYEVSPVKDYRHKLTTKSKKIMVDLGAVQ